MNDKLMRIQSKLSVPKNQRNSFGGYNYRSCEDILEALKPLLEEEKLLLTMCDEVVNIGNRNYVKATVTLTDGDKKADFTAYAREEEDKKGMDGSQITGASSSYARKYALNGLFLIDDTKDSDATNTHETKDYGAPIREVAGDVPACPRCGGEMWDNRTNKKYPNSPDFKCKDKTCLDDKGYNTAIWMEKEAKEPEQDIDEVQRKYEETIH